MQAGYLVVLRGLLEARGTRLVPDSLDRKGPFQDFVPGLPNLGYIDSECYSDQA